MCGAEIYGWVGFLNGKGEYGSPAQGRPTRGSVVVGLVRARDPTRVLMSVVSLLVNAYSYGTVFIRDSHSLITMITENGTVRYAHKWFLSFLEVNLCKLPRVAVELEFCLQVQLPLLALSVNRSVPGHDPIAHHAETRKVRSVPNEGSVPTS